MSTINELDCFSETIDDREDLPFPAIPITHGGMVDVALSDLGAVLINVFLAEDEIPHFHAEPV